jgi:hypothetical protein
LQWAARMGQMKPTYASFFSTFWPSEIRGSAFEKCTCLRLFFNFEACSLALKVSLYVLRHFVFRQFVLPDTNLCVLSDLALAQLFSTKIKWIRSPFFGYRAQHNEH